MKFKVVVSALVAAACVAGSAMAVEVSSINVVGYFTISLTSNDYTFVSLPMEKLPASRGVATANTTSTIQDSAQNWTPGFFATGVTNSEPTGLSTFYVAITDTNSAFEGRYYTIVTNDATTLTVQGADFLAADLNGMAYKIVAYQRVRDVFGEPGSPKLVGSNFSTAATCDKVYMWSLGTWGNPIFYRTTDNHWRQGGGLADNTIINRDGGCFIQLRAGNPVPTLTVAGEVLASSQTVVINNGFGVIGGVAVVDQTMIDTGLQSLLTGGSFSTGTNVDLIYSWESGTWGNPIFWRTTDSQWRRGGSSANTNVSIRADRAYLVNKKSAGVVEWSRPSPLL